MAEHPMNGGDGPYSYAKNSTYQKKAAEAVGDVLRKAIAEKLDTKISLSSNTFHIADLGCSVGPNTFFSVQNIIEAVEIKYQTDGGLDSHQIPEFQVLFNDHTPNDFNTLFKSLPPNRRYYAAGVPGSFYGRVFPSSSIEFFTSSYALQWLSRVPEAVLDKSSPTWNRGRIHYSNSKDEVVRAHEAQYAQDMECFLHSRAQELVCGGLMALTIPGRPSGSPHSQSSSNISLDLLGFSLMELARKGVVSQEKVDSFNIPVYIMSPQELEAAVERNGSFRIEMLENLPPIATLPIPQELAAHWRAGMEGIIKQTFGEDILDELFDLYCKKVEEHSSMFLSGKANNILLVLKRKEF